jgi:hypothetical protein
MSLIRLALLLVLATPGLVALGQDQDFTSRDIQETWVGKALVGTTASGGDVTIRLNVDGTASVKAGATEDTGTWRISDTGYCTTWRKIRSGRETCFTAKRSPTRVVILNPDGSVSGYITEAK